MYLTKAVEQELHAVPLSNRCLNDKPVFAKHTCALIVMSICSQQLVACDAVDLHGVGER